MKIMIKNFSTILLVLICTFSKGQITLDHSYQNCRKFQTGYLTNGGLTYLITDSLDVAYVYNNNHLLLTSFPLYIPINSLIYGGDTWVSDNLVNSDNLIELIYSVSGNGVDSTFIINQNGVIASYYGRASEIIKSGNDFKLILRKIYTLNDEIWTVYSLPGTYPCDACSNLSGLAGPSSGIVQRISNAYPNPSSTFITISYNLPLGINTAEIIITDTQGKEVGSYKIGKDFTDIKITTDNLSNGTYLYSIYSANTKISEGKFMISN